MIQRIMRRAVALSAAAVLGVAFAGKAEALTLPFDHLILGVYGNDTEYIADLGSISDLFGTPGTTTAFNVDLSQLGGSNAIRFSALEFDFDPDTGDLLGSASSQRPPALWTAGERGSVDLTQIVNFGATWSALADIELPAGSEAYVAKANAYSWTSTWGPEGLLQGGVPVQADGTLGAVLSVIGFSGPYGSTALDLLGTITIDANGLITVASVPAPVPLPASLVLFGTGLAGLVGVARRRLVGA